MFLLNLDIHGLIRADPAQSGLACQVSSRIPQQNGGMDVLNFPN